jgi:hypothetical protein
MHATIWMNLKIIVLNEISQTQKDKYFMIPRRVKYTVTKKYDGSCQGLE